MFGVPTDASFEFAKVIRRDEVGEPVVSHDIRPVDAILPPLEPSALYCVGLNYRAHAEETGFVKEPGNPITFLKAVSSCTGHQCPIVIPAVAKDEVDFEVELAVVIGAAAKDVPVESALSHVLGYTVANDVSARRWQGKKGGGQWSRAKSFDTFCPLGPSVVPAALVPDPQALRMTTEVNGELMQDGHTSDMIWSVAEIISYLSQDTTLLPGTVILTGTPAGVGYSRSPPVYLQAGDEVTMTIEGVGVLRNTVIDAPRD
jgi:2-keto-4-pentenoate hydratase/2-oxohepta-3-ene-1,7-dioic acid hydratase in catechol pathway